VLLLLDLKKIRIFANKFSRKEKAMTTITLNYDERNILATKTIEYILSLGVFTAEKIKKTSEIEVALQEIENGEINRYDHVDDLLQKINS
jgi:hypothetical protein